MSKRDTRTDAERVLAENMYNIYMSDIVKTQSDYESQLRQLVVDLEKNRRHKTIRYLKSILEEHIDKYADDKQVADYYRKRKSMKNVIPNYVKFCDELFAVPAKKRFEYLDSKSEGYVKVKEYLGKYSVYNGKYSYLAADFMKEYCLVMAKRRYKEKSRKERLDFNDSCLFFDTLIENGYYSIPDYLDYLDCAEKSNERGLISTRKRKIVNHDPNKWKCYEYKMELNRKKTYLMLQDRIEDFMAQLVNGYLHGEPVDVIDYYTTVGISFKKFKEICAGHLSDSSMALFNVFITSYMSIDAKYFDCDSYSKINYINLETGVPVSDEEKLCIIDFLRKNNVPVAYFPVALSKYMKGNLDIKVKSLKKEF